MAEKLVKARIKKENGYLYYIGKDGCVYKSKMSRGGKKGGKREKVNFQNGHSNYPIKKEDGYLYFLDKQGDISRAKMVRR
ncbi:hypothetical protein ACFL6Y_08520 [Elusimicrobiota bacterium]